jgi:hypothetical protein
MLTVIGDSLDSVSAILVSERRRSASTTRRSADGFLKIRSVSGVVPFTRVSATSGGAMFGRETRMLFRHFGSLEPADIKRLRQLEQENGLLKKILPDRDLELDVLKEITRKKW